MWTYKPFWYARVNVIQYHSVFLCDEYNFHRESVTVANHMLSLHYVFDGTPYIVEHVSIQVHKDM